jgi:hypothetical protein
MKALTRKQIFENAGKRESTEPVIFVYSGMVRPPITGLLQEDKLISSASLRNIPMATSTPILQIHDYKNQIIY